MKPKKRVVSKKLTPKKISCLANTITNIDLTLRGVVGLTGMAVCFTLAFSGFLIFGAVSRVVSDVAYGRLPWR